MTTMPLGCAAASPVEPRRNFRTLNGSLHLRSTPTGLTHLLVQDWGLGHRWPVWPPTGATAFRATGVSGSDLTNSPRQSERRMAPNGSAVDASAVIARVTKCQCATRRLALTFRPARRLGGVPMRSVFPIRPMRRVFLFATVHGWSPPLVPQTSPTSHFDSQIRTFSCPTMSSVVRRSKRFSRCSALVRRQSAVEAAGVHR